MTLPSAMERGTERWLIAEIPSAFRPIADLADRHGFIACLFGSTVKAGEGRDLDILMMRRMRAFSDPGAFLQDFGGCIVKTFRQDGCGNHSYEIARGGKIFHFVFGRF